MQQSNQLPVEYITIKKSYSTKGTVRSRNKMAACDNYCDQSHRSHMVFDNDDDDLSVSYCEPQPSLTRTYDDGNDSDHYDLIADMISYDEISVDLDSTAPLNHPVSQHMNIVSLGQRTMEQ